MDTDGTIILASLLGFTLTGNMTNIYATVPLLTYNAPINTASCINFQKGFFCQRVLEKKAYGK